MTESNPVLAALDAIHAQGHGSFAIVRADAARNLFVQFAADEGASGLYAEIVGDVHLAPDDHLTAEQRAEMRARGWTGDGAENWWREWPNAETSEARQRIAFESLDALRDLHGADGEVRVEAVLEGPGAAEATAALAARGVHAPGMPAAGAPRRAVLYIAAAAALLALVLSIFLRAG